MAYVKQLKSTRPGSVSTRRVPEAVLDATVVDGGRNFPAKKIGLSLALGLLLVSGGWFAWGYVRGGSSNGDGPPSDGGAISIGDAISKEKLADEGGVKDTPSPINGVMYTKERAKIWSERRPLAVVIENHVESRPPYGLTDAEMVYEAVAEGGITRFVAIFRASQAPRLEPIRSVRNYFIDWAGDVDAILVHHGGANSTDERTDALGNLDRLKIDHIDCIEGGSVCSRDNDRFAPHNSMSDTTLLWGDASARGMNKPKDIKSWKFKDDASEAERGVAQEVSYNFWDDPDYLVRWVYDKPTNMYKRFNGNLLTDSHIDANYTKQIESKTVILQEIPQDVVDDGTPYPHLVYGTIGSGKASILMDGKRVEATWKKESRTSRTVYTALSGEEFSFNRGQVWISMIPPGTIVTAR